MSDIETIVKRTPFYILVVRRCGETASWMSQVLISRRAVMAGMAREILWDLGFSEGRRSSHEGAPYANRTHIAARVPSGVLFRQSGGLDI